MNTEKRISIQHIKGRDYWIKVVGMLQQNWALIEENSDQICTVYFVDDGENIFDSMEFALVNEARQGLLDNGFHRYADNPSEHISLPSVDFSGRPRGYDPIYSSGRYWKS
jgi:hypothetical protein